MLRSLLVALVALTAGCRAHSSATQAEVARAPVDAPDAAQASGELVADAELQRVQKRARYIVESEKGAISATDLLLARPDLDRSRMNWFFTVPRGNAWYSVFGRFNPQDVFVPAYAYRAPIEFSGEMEDFPVESLPEGMEALARAVSAACERVFQVHGRKQLNPVVVEEDGGITVYVLQGFDDSDLYLLGGDFRFKFSQDGRQKLQELPLHQGLIPVSVAPDADGERPQFSAHAHVLFPGPLETELALVMLYPALGGLFVGGGDQDRVYALSPDGTIREVLLSREEVLRELRPDGTFAPPEALNVAPEPGADVVL
ncbi:hypothetical protein D7W82_26585 [Corallococcus sp. CA049B]|uniref:hypothetical protein n=1 Tax=Corallococcus sp. CA049B TaxID=2316730 RepID=UPI000EA2C65E|nr:hypothetical protein [Corallococcus sp. CA049B]RKG82482.1 hypothetical protein D7W82_26585 [Corallococcus sp. CA049B]